MAKIAKKKKGRSVDSWKSKRWYKLRAPKAFEEKEFGEAISSDPKLLLGRKIKTTLREITGNIPHQNVQLTFIVDDVKGDSVSTSLAAFEMSKSHVGRQTRRMRTLVTAITEVSTKDGYKLRLKAISFGHGSTFFGQKKEIRRIMDEEMKVLASALSYEKLMAELVYAKPGGEIFKKVRKIYPLSKTEIIKSKILAKPEKK